ncbi:hypothetical protein [Enterobacter cloacae]|uniref:hypothetical protein n=1 Tax=Enterobacter cloacae TaxID=550 RepID=UPI002B1FD036|nr:hypothetical protein [Enterobacter cloacae]MEA5217572.1 hypothetical protein [Enterobacter cloacae]
MNGIQEIMRLRLLQNAIIYYSGGVLNLEARISHLLEENHAVSPEIKMLLDDMALYLRDVKYFVEFEGYQ